MDAKKIEKVMHGFLREKQKQAHYKAKNQDEPETYKKSRYDPFDEDAPHSEKIRKQQQKQKQKQAQAQKQKEITPENTALVLSSSQRQCKALHLGEVKTFFLKVSILKYESLVAGDEIVVSGEWVESVLPRRSLLSRPDPNINAQERLIASNIDLIVIIASINTPPLRVRLLDRYLVAAAKNQIETAICITKLDLATVQEKASLSGLLQPYRALQIPTFTVSTTMPGTIEEIEVFLRGKRSVFVGHSGVGKSSLLNALVGEQMQTTGHVDFKGRHTTTGASLLSLPRGGEVIDTPGIREFGLWGVSPADLTRYFPDISALSSSCRFFDCLHQREPHCAVRSAISSASLSVERYNAYLRLLQSLLQREE